MTWDIRARCRDCGVEVMVDAVAASQPLAALSPDDRHELSLFGLRAELRRHEIAAHEDEGAWQEQRCPVTRCTWAVRLPRRVGVQAVLTERVQAHIATAHARPGPDRG